MGSGKNMGELYYSYTAFDDNVSFDSIFLLCGLKVTISDIITLMMFAESWVLIISYILMRPTSFAG